MTQITAILGDDANPSIIRHVLENMKGVLKVSISKNKSTDTSTNDMEADAYQNLLKLKSKIDTSLIDINDPRTRHIMRGTDLLSDLDNK